MKKIVLILFLVLNHFIAKSQINLVPNSSFEDTLSSHGSSDILENWIYYWRGGRGYFNSYQIGVYGEVPINIFGHQYTHTGNAYCGIYTYGKYTSPIRHYIQIKLNETLQSGKKYKVSFYVSLADTMHAYNNSIGAYFTPDSFFISNGGLINQVPQIENNPTNGLGSKTDWTLICDTFVSSGNERWITIGNFLSDSLSLITPLDSVCSQPNPFNCGSYYYIDDVSVTLIDETGIEEQRQSEFSLFPNPNTGNFKLQYKGIITKPFILSITDVCGKLTDQVEIKNQTTNYENTSLVNGLYFYSLRNGDEEVGRGKILVVK